MASDVTLTSTATSAAKTQAQSVKLAEDFTQFLTLLTTQLQNQDPLNPMDSTEFTNQLVQFSQVEQSINTNQKLDDLLALQLGGLSTVALGYVGMDVTYTSTEMNWDGAHPGAFGPWQRIPEVRNQSSAIRFGRRRAKGKS